jgi:hemerythrin-like domain-containing protein
MIGKSKSATMGTPATRKARARRKDAIAILRADHARILNLVRQLKQPGESNHLIKLAQTLCTELKIHAALEEELFYPSARTALKDSQLIEEYLVEHGSAATLISAIEAGSPGDPSWHARISVLGDHIGHHIKAEQNQVFREVRAAKRLDLMALGDAIRARREHLSATDL